MLQVRGFHDSEAFEDSDVHMGWVREYRDQRIWDQPEFRDFPGIRRPTRRVAGLPSIHEFTGAHRRP